MLAGVLCRSVHYPSPACAGLSVACLPSSCLPDCRLPVSCPPAPAGRAFRGTGAQLASPRGSYLPYSPRECRINPPLSSPPRLRVMGPGPRCVGSPGPRDLAPPGSGPGMTQARSIGTCVTRVLVSESVVFSYGPVREGRGGAMGRNGAGAGGGGGGGGGGKGCRATGRLLCTTAARAARSREPGRLARGWGIGDSRHPAGPSTPRRRAGDHRSGAGAA